MKQSRLAMAAFLLLWTLATGAQPAPADRFKQWMKKPEAAVMADYQRYLTDNGLGEVAPMHALLRSARLWRECHASEYVLPPKSLWPNLLPTLRVLRDLQAAGLVEGSKVASGYRDSTLNTCAGGSARSRHVTNNALDFDLSSSDKVARLCEYWHRKGPALKLGLGFYTDTTIHLDTSGFRTWGSDHTRRTSLCNAPAPTP
jgi:uncharacterized protein YcbK (DUF882 family)